MTIFLITEPDTLGRLNRLRVVAANSEPEAKSLITDPPLRRCTIQYICSNVAEYAEPQIIAWYDAV